VRPAAIALFELSEEVWRPVNDALTDELTDRIERRLDI